MTTLQVHVFDAVGTRFPLDQLGVVAGVKVLRRWQRTGGCGPWEASWTLDLDPNSSPPMLARGNRVEVYDASHRIFSGVLAEPARGRPWELYAVGYVREAARYATQGETRPDYAVDAAIARGWPVIRDGSLSATAFVANPAESNPEPLPTVAALLDGWAGSQQLRWGVDADRVIFTATDATTPKWVFTAPDAVMGVADDEYVSRVVVRYATAVNADGVVTDSDYVVAEDLDAKARWGAREEVVDLTDRGLMAPAAAQAIADGILAKYAARLGFTNGFTATALTLRHYATGAPARLPLVEAGDMVRLANVMDTAGNLSVGLAMDVVLGDVAYDDDARELSCAPVGLVPRVFSDIVESLAPKKAAA